jgi:hypothetical protein
VAVTLDAARAELARRQAALLAALLDDAPAPEGMDPARVRVQAVALAAKRAAHAPRPSRRWWQRR